ncbi:MAG: hypothetical protein ACLTYN_17390 [Dysosmobacter welbionis]
MLIMGLMQSCTSMFGGGTSGLVASSYLSEDADLTGAEAACAGWRRSFKNTWTPTRLPTTMTNITLTWTRSSMTLMSAVRHVGAP